MGCKDKTSRLRRLGRAVWLFVKWTLLVGVCLTVTAALIGALAYRYYNAQLPRDLDAVTDYQPRSLSQMYSDDGELIGEFYLERRIVVPLESLGSMVVNAFLAAEDARFFVHRGVDMRGITRALLSNLAAGRVVQGGSTITQQVVKNLLLTPERSLDRKIKEAILSFRLERELNKEEILHTYLNMVYLGHGAYGVEAAARTYFGRHASELTLAQSAMLAGLVKSPSRYSPYFAFERAKERQRYVLKQMVENGLCDPAQARAAESEPIIMFSRPDVNTQAAPYFVEHVRRLVMARFGGRGMYRQGLRIDTTLRVDWQRAARMAVRHGIDELTARQGYLGPVRVLPTGARESFLDRTWNEVVTRRRLDGVTGEALNRLVDGEIYDGVVLYNEGDEIRVGIGPHEVLLEPADFGIKAPELRDGRWIRRSASELLVPGAEVSVRVKGLAEDDGQPRVSIAGVPVAQGALISIEPANGYVRAMIGGYDFSRSRFNRAVQSRRQPGSSFKLVIYANALESGMHQMSVVPDAPLTIRTGGGQVWSPRNYTGRYLGPVTLRTALEKSLNTVSVRLVQRLGVQSAISVARKLGIRSPLTPNLTLALGSSGVSVLELTAAYAGIANYGEAVTPVFVTRITDATGAVLYSLAEDEATGGSSLSPSVLAGLEGAEQGGRQAVDPANAYVLIDMLKNVVASGTGRRVKALGRPTAGKTGTTNGHVDAWFLGFVPQLATGVWVGVDTLKPLGPSETGGKTAAPIWLEFMQHATSDMPVEDFEIPEGVMFSRADPKTGEPTARTSAPFFPFSVKTLPVGVVPEVGRRHPADELE